MPARVRSERTSLSNCANAARTPSINLPVDVSSIGSVADRNEMPSDCRCERRAKWSYLSRAKRVKLNTTTKWTRPLFIFDTGLRVTPRLDEPNEPHGVGQIWRSALARA